MSELPLPPSEIVVLPNETPVPGLRAYLRQVGFFVPPGFARRDWGPALIRAAREEASLPAAANPDDVSGYPPWRDELPPEEPDPEPMPRISTGARGRAPDAYDNVDEHPTGAFRNPPRVEPGRQESTMQIDYQTAAALANQSAPHVGDSTTQAAHRTERMDLSEWGYLLRIVLICESKDFDPLQMLEGLRPTVGEWLHAEIDQAARLEYDRRFRRDTEKKLAKFLTDTIGRFPIIKVDIQAIA